MKVYLYSKGKNLIKNSGIAKAMDHQEKMLNEVNIEVTKEMENDVNIVHINTVFPSSLREIKKAKKNNKKVVIYAHSTKEDFKNSFLGSNLIAPLFKKWITHCYKQGDIIITPTPYSKKLLSSYNIKNKIYSLSNGIDTSFFLKTENRNRRFREKYNLENEDKVIISVGHYIERKGILDFIQLSKDLPNYKFIWFGYTQSYLLPSKIKNAIKNAPSNLTFAGFVNSSDLRDAYCGANLFSFMTKEETEGIVILEALSCKIPSIIYDIDVYKDWLKNDENIYKAQNYENFKKLVVEIIENKKKDLSKQGWKISDQRSLKNTGLKLIEIYKDSNLI